MTTATEPLIEIHEIPCYFGGGWPDIGRSAADVKFGTALDALVALTGRSKEDDPAIRLIVDHLYDAFGELLDNACNFGRRIPDGLDSGIDEWDDDTLETITGHRRKRSAA
jgi:hypothetical protein